MNVHFVITGFLPELFGGAEVYTQHLAKALIARDHRVQVNTLDLKHRRGFPTDEPFEGVPVHRLGFTFPHRTPLLYGLQFYPELYEEATELFTRERPDIVHVTNSWFVPAMALAAMHLGIPVVGTHVDFLWTNRDSHLLTPDLQPCTEAPESDCRASYADLNDAQFSLAMRLRREQFSLLAQGYAFHHCPCPLLAEHIAHLGADPAAIGVWPYGLPEDVATDRQPKIPSDVLRLGFVGRWNRIKGVDILLDAMGRLPADAPVKLLLFGEQEVWSNDTYGAQLDAAVKRLANVEIRGRFMPDQVAAIHREIDVLVTPSIWPENSPVSMLEALALGTPCLCADGAGMINLIAAGENGLHFRSRDAADLAEQIMRLAGDPALVARLQQNAQCLRTIEQDATQFEDIYAAVHPHRTSAWHTRSLAYLDTIRLAVDAAAPPAYVPRLQKLAAELVAAGATNVALFGAGRHTLRILGEDQWPASLQLKAILDENPKACGGRILGVPVLPLAEAEALGVDAIIVSSDAWELQMLAKLAPLAKAGLAVRGIYHEAD
jgi:glycosyltransferase involved in cell wall biosynthesis